MHKHLCKCNIACTILTSCRREIRVLILLHSTCSVICSYLLFKHSILGRFWLKQPLSCWLSGYFFDDLHAVARSSWKGVCSSLPSVQMRVKDRWLQEMRSLPLCSDEGEGPMILDDSRMFLLFTLTGDARSFLEKFVCMQLRFLFLCSDEGEGPMGLPLLRRVELQSSVQSTTCCTAFRLSWGHWAEDDDEVLGIAGLSWPAF